MGRESKSQDCPTKIGTVGNMFSSCSLPTHPLNTLNGSSFLSLPSLSLLYYFTCFTDIL